MYLLVYSLIAELIVASMAAALGSLVIVASKLGVMISPVP